MAVRISQEFLEVIVSLASSALTGTVADNLDSWIDATSIISPLSSEIAEDFDVWTDDIVVILGFRRVIEEDFDGLTDAVAVALPGICQDVSDDFNNWTDDVSLDFQTPLFITIDDDLNSWLDDLNLYFNYSVALEEDDLNSFNDIIILFKKDFLNISDTLNHWYDYELETHLDIYLEPLLREVTDDLNSLGDNLDALEYLFDAVDVLYECGDDLFFNDAIDINFEYRLDLSDELNSWVDEVTAMPGDYVELSYDEMTSTWADEIVVNFILDKSITDSFALSDSVSAGLLNPLLTQSVADSLNNWSDALQSKESVKRQIVDWLALYDEIQLFMTVIRHITDSMILADEITVLMNPSQLIVVADVLSFNDAIAVVLSTTAQSISPEDALDLWNELVRIELEQNLLTGDTMALNDAVEVERGDGDLSYIRRYLNDVIR